MNEIPMYMFIFFMVINLVLVYKAITNTDLLSMFSSFISAILSFVLAKVSINGQLVHKFGHISTDNVLVFETFTIQNSSQSLIFSMMAIFMTIRIIIILVEKYKDVYSEVTE